MQQALDPLCLFVVNINPESRVKVARGPAAAELVEQGWRMFLVKVVNEAGVTAPLRVGSSNAQKLHGGISRLGFKINPLEFPIIPLLIGPEKEAMQISGKLLDNGFFIPAIRTPSVPKGKARLRITVSAGHTQEDIDRLIHALANL